MGSFLILFVLLIVCARKNIQFELYERSPIIKGLMASGSKVALELFTFLNNEHNKNENLVISPLSIFTSLTMACMGANDKTKKELKTALYLKDLTDAQILDKFEFILNQLEIVRKFHNVDFVLGNKMFITNSIDISNNFTNLIGNKFKGEIQHIDFRNSSSSFINNWISYKTKNKIINILNNEYNPINMDLLLINSFYYKNDWRVKFDVNLIEIGGFYVDSVNIGNVNLMVSRNKTYLVGYKSQLYCRCLELPHHNVQFKTYFVLPDSDFDLMSLYSSLDYTAFINPREYFHLLPSKLDVKLPRFKFGNSVNLKKHMQQLGYSIIFDEAADFSGISEIETKLKISEVKHAAYIEVNESGKEDDNDIRDGDNLNESGEKDDKDIRDEFNINEEIEPFIADRPFLFFVLDTMNKAILIHGKFVKPTEIIVQNKYANNPISEYPLIFQNNSPMMKI